MELKMTTEARIHDSTTENPMLYNINIEGTGNLLEIECLNSLLTKQVKVEPVVKQAACGKWQRKKPDKPCYFLHRYNKKDDHPSLFEAYIDTDVLCVANIQDDEFVETMEGFADGQFYIIEK